MRMLRTILVATDLRPSSQGVVDVATRLASTFGGRVTLFHVLETYPHWTMFLTQQQEKAIDALHEMVGELRTHDVVADHRLSVSSSPSDSILEEASRIDADLILVGAGRSLGPGQFSVGPVAEEVIQRAPNAVLAVRPGSPDLSFGTILCPVDQSEPSERGLVNAIRLARVFGSRLVVLGVVPDVSWLTAAFRTATLDDAKRAYQRKWSHEFEQLVTKRKAPDVEMKTELRHGAPHEQILQAVEDHEADLLVMGATGKSDIARTILGSTTRRVIQNLPCSILTVKGEDALSELFESELLTINDLMADGNSALDSGEHETALAKFRQVLVRNPFHAGAISATADAYDRLGQKDRARFYRERVEKIEECAWT